jgi:hypothetical protein
MSKSPSSNPSPDPDAEDSGELPVVPPPQGEAGAAKKPPVDSDPLAKWRAARELEEDLADIFDEDRVTHKHGNAEPEAD